jgi:hypothetical protein
MARNARGSFVTLAAALLATSTAAPAQAPAGDDPYRRYITTAPEFQPVRQDPAFLFGRWKTWIYMLWRYQWSNGDHPLPQRQASKIGWYIQSSSC